MKKIISLTLTLLLVMGTMLVFPVSAESKIITSGDWQYRISEDGNAVLTDYLGTQTKVILPDTIDGKKVTKAKTQVFKKELINVTIGKYLRGLSGYHFVGNDNLIKISVSKNNKNYSSINGALYNKSKTKLIAYPAGKTKISFSTKIRNIGKKAFENNKNIKNITIPSTVKRINDDAFAGCKNLQKVTIPNNITYIGGCVFAYCKNLRTVSFQGNKKLTAGGDIFFGCKSLNNATYILSNASKTADCTGMFSYCSALEKVTIPSGVKVIANYAFEECDNLKTITIPSSVKKIGTEAFGYIMGFYVPKPNKDFIVKGKKGSAAEKYAKANKLKFKAI